MVQIINTAELSPRPILDDWTRRQVYNGLDCCVTQEVCDGEEAQHNKSTLMIHDFELACLAPAVDMMLRGIPVDEYQRHMLKNKYYTQRARVDSILQKFAIALTGKGTNARSKDQLIYLFYDCLNIPKIWIHEKGKRRLGMPRDILEQLTAYRYARPVALCVMKFREISKKIEVLEQGVDPDGRMRFNLNVGGTTTGRWSSSKNIFGRGMNGQNITEELREIFWAETGMKLSYADLEKAENFVSAYDSQDEAYIKACLGPDLHTEVCMMVWTEHDWRHNDFEHNIRLAEEPNFIRHFTRRDVEKRLSYGSNYWGQPYALAHETGVGKDVVEDFQERYFGAFPGIKRNIYRIAQEIQTKGYLFTPMGRRRHFYGRRNEDKTIKDAVAHIPQSTVGDILNLGLWRVWNANLPIHLFLQVHDAILFAYWEKDEDWILPKVHKLMTIPIPIHGRVMTIPVESKIGWNWRRYNEKTNPDGIKAWKGADERTRRFGPSTPLINRLAA